jgi:hypothetical protein
MKMKKKKEKACLVVKTNKYQKKKNYFSTLNADLVAN